MVKTQQTARRRRCLRLRNRRPGLPRGALSNARRATTATNAEQRIRENRLTWRWYDGSDTRFLDGAVYCCFNARVCACDRGNGGTFLRQERETTKTGARRHDRHPGHLAHPRSIRPAEGRARPAHRQPARSSPPRSTTAAKRATSARTAATTPRARSRASRRPASASCRSCSTTPRSARRPSSPASPCPARSSRSSSTTARHRDVPDRHPPGGRDRRQARGLLAQLAARRRAASTPRSATRAAYTVPNGNTVKVDADQRGALPLLIRGIRAG